ncbi:MAG: gliding motility-associated C-terminal domain-containing protein, partial [Bacteroidota bacterium]
PNNIQRSKENPLCNGESVTLSVQDQPAAPDAKWQWFDNPDGSGSPLAETEDFTTPALAVGTSSFYVAQINRCDDRSALTQIDVEVIAGPAASFVGIPDTLCVDVPQLFLADQVPGSSPGAYAWNFGNEANPEQAQGLGPHSVTYNQTGTQTIRLSAEGQGCSSEIEKEITVVPPPILTIDGEELRFENLAISGVSPRFELGTNTGSADFSWTWTLLTGPIEGSQSGSGSGAILDEIWTLAEDTERALIEVEMAVSGFCDSTFQFRIVVQNFIFIPNILTPNGDTFNDTWGIILSDQAPQAEEFSIQLYNRQGICVCGCGESFSVSDAQNWSGAGLPSGAYWYLIEGPTNFSQRGSLTILR